MLEITQHNLTLNDQSVAYGAHGSQDNEKAVIFLHGWRSTSTAWRPIIERIDPLDNVTYYVIDLPGFGLSDNPAHPFTVDDYAQIVKDFISSQDIQETVLVGHSFGGQVALRMAQDSSVPVKRVIGIGSAGVRSRSFFSKLSGLVAKLVKPLFSLPGMRGGRDKIYTWFDWDDYINRPDLKETYQNIIRDDETERLADVLVPVDLIWGVEDTATPLRDGKRMRDELPVAKLHIIEGAGHYAFIDKPETVTGIIERVIIYTFSNDS